MELSPKDRQMFRLLHLRKMHNGVFLMLTMGVPFVIYGFMNLESARERVYKRGLGKVGKKGSCEWIPLSENRIVESCMNSLERLAWGT
mmetsp:Transcript_3517/g.6625  ORF Transcript_3517/g.6625 Transcript_3517/m.6625 type:complete len:88 (-) Transcript_3517:2151-2414(-)